MIDSRRGSPRTAGRQLALPLDTRKKAPEPKPERKSDADVRETRRGMASLGDSCGGLEYPLNRDTSQYRCANNALQPSVRPVLDDFRVHGERLPTLVLQGLASRFSRTKQVNHLLARQGKSSHAC